ncbi:hypothetical protein [Bacillus sp. PK3_68]|uniref:hypothetical protein n=1 Tax=Bacillus sp. PK3_68 TaxID=2027408 RepID=UPI000E72B8CE|nr:hypothetical protein [Bacillus sp. PK3_68]RJS60124.1 hypothetical protein CJ483_08650 [Bacillus sp. PK3_68]
METELERFIKVSILEKVSKVAGTEIFDEELRIKKLEEELKDARKSLADKHEFVKEACERYGFVLTENKINLKKGHCEKYLFFESAEVYRNLKERYGYDDKIIYCRASDFTD